MKKQIITMALLLGCLVAVGVNQAQAQIIYPVKANIPFSFYVEEKLLPAGEYTITEKYQGLMEIQRDDGKATAIFMTNSDQEQQAPTTSELIFNRYGNKTFLSRIEEQGDRDDAVLMKSKLEKRAEMNEVEEGPLSALLHY